MPQPQKSPAWASIAVGSLLDRPWREGTVQASGEVAAYVSIPDAELIALLRPEAVRLPVGVCVRGPLPAVEQPVRVGHGLIEADGRVWRPVRWWDPRPRLPVVGLLEHGPGLLGVVRDEPDSAFGRPLPEALEVAAALAAGRAQPALDVIGLGPGLTPAADDVVAGAMAALALLGRLPGTIRLEIAARARTHTTALSAALLAAAGRGQMIPQAARMLTIVATGGPRDRVREAAADLFGVGSTSGHDLCAGMAGALGGAA
jgi:Protein of unknown function (DUF2877)